MRLKKSARVKQSRRGTHSTLAKRFARAKKSSAKTLARVTRSIHFPREIGAAAIIAAVFCVAASAMLVTALQSREPRNGATIDVRAKTPTELRVIETPEATAWNVPEERTAPKPSAQQAPVTVTGCLEADNETFRLKNTTGVDAPKARSWKSGFLKKNPASIQIVDSTNRVQLPSHVGQRVVVTGTLVDREMQVRSLQRVATSCKQEA